jgi:hypothetical protein
MGTPSAGTAGRHKGNVSVLGLGKKAKVALNPIQMGEMTIWLSPKNMLDRCAQWMYE